MKTVNFTTNPAYQLSNVQYSQFMRDMLHHLGLINKAEMTDEELNQLIATLTTLLGDFDKVMKIISKSILTNDVEELDAVRDVSIRALRQAVKTELLSADPAVLQAARSVEILMSSYGAIPRLLVEEETRAIDSVVTQLESAQYQPLVQLLGIGSKVVRLKTDNEAFKAKYSERTEEYIAKNASNNRELRLKMGETYKLLCDYVLTMARLEKGALYDKVVSTINTIRTQYNAQVGRSGERKAGEEKS